MKRRINEEIGTSVSDSVKSIVFIDIGSYLANKAGSLVIMVPEVGPQKIMKWSKFVHTNPMYQENKSHFDALTARFSGNTILNSIYAKVNKIKSATVASAEENTTREQQITRELSRAGRYIQSKLTDIEKQLFAKISPDLRNPSLFLVKSLNDKLTSTISTPEPEQETPDAPEAPETPETSKTPETPETPPEATTKPAAEPKPAATKKVAPEPATSEPTATAEPTAPVAKPATKPAEKSAPKPVATKPAEKPAPKPAPKAAPKPAPKPAAKPVPVEEPEDDDKKTEESIRKIKNVIREYVLREIQDVVSEAVLDDTMDWKSLSTPLIIGGKDVGFVLPNGIKLNTALNQVWVESPDLIHKVSRLLAKRVIRPANYQKTHKILSFGYNQIDEDAIGLVLFDIK